MHDERPSRGDLPLVKLASWILAAVGLIYILLGALMAVTYVGLGLAAAQGEEQVFLVVMGLGMGAFCAAFGVPMVAAAVGLRRGDFWAWVIAVIVGGMFAPSICLPIGALLLYAMLVQETREAFLNREG